MNNNEIHLNPEMTFRNLVFMNMQQLTNFPYIEKDFDALTDYQLLCLIVKFLNDVIDNSNEQNTSITNLYNAFLGLQEYVNQNFNDLTDAFNNLDQAMSDYRDSIDTLMANYKLEIDGEIETFETYVTTYLQNLDVQQEINNKLDDMLEQGTLQEIIYQFIQSNVAWCFNTVSEMKLATNFINGSYSQTLGYRTVNDGGKALYKIRTKTNEDVTNEMTLIALYDNTLVAELITNDYINLEQLGAYGDGTHDDTQYLRCALSLNLPIILKDNSTYNIIKIYTTDIPNINIQANNKSNIKWNITSTQEIENFEGMITDDNPTGTADPTGGNVYLKNINFNGNGDNITSFPNEQNFGMFHLKVRNNVIIENCTFEKIHCDAINLRGYEKCIINNCNFNHIGLYQNADGTRNGLTITREYTSRSDDQNYSLTNIPITEITNCIFDYITDECVRIDGCSNLLFENNNCENIGQHIIESGHKTDGSNYSVKISNCIANKIGQGVYTFGADGGGTWNYTGKILVENSKFTNMCYEDDFSLYKRNARPFIIPGYTANYNTYSPDIEIINCEFKSINDTLTYTANQKMIFGKNVTVKDSIFEYYNNSASIPMFQGVNVNLDNVSYKITVQNGSKFIVNGLAGNINIRNSVFDVEKFTFIFDLNNCKTYIENCRFYENTDTTSYRYMINVKSSADYNSSISIINSIIVNKDVSATSTNCYAFTVTENSADYKLDIMRLIGNYYTFSNLNNKAYSGGSSETYNLLINEWNNKYNA